MSRRRAKTVNTCTWRRSIVAVSPIRRAVDCYKMGQLAAATHCGTGKLPSSMAGMATVGGHGKPVFCGLLASSAFIIFEFKSIIEEKTKRPT